MTLILLFQPAGGTPPDPIVPTDPVVPPTNGPGAGGGGSYGFGVPIIGDEISVWMNDTEYDDFVSPPLVVTVPKPAVKRVKRDLAAWLTANEPKVTAAPLLKVVEPVVVDDAPAISAEVEAERVRIEDEEDTELRLFLLLAS